MTDKIRACERRLEQQRNDEEHRAVCDSDKVKREMCTKPNRVSEYIELFQSRGLWEVADMADKVIMEGLSCAIHAMIDEELAHKCMGRAKCPLMLQLEEQREGINDMLENIPKLESESEYYAP
ncbi:hypothetical protein N0V92_004141 [Colletotrichum tropicale]|nr:hypothetical protein N0V92_004141 [Colletotrichum tropicale]